MGKITLIIGGARSGKSSLAVSIAQKNYRRVAFIPTCVPLDKEMKERVRLHKKSRPRAWKTFEHPNISEILKNMPKTFDLIIIDCLTLWVSNLLCGKQKQQYIERSFNEILFLLKKIKADSILVANEVGLGIVPENDLAREFRDVAGRINQAGAANADSVFFMFAGLPVQLKGKLHG